MMRRSLLLGLQVFLSQSLRPDDKGYIVYCPCMGRFGNQADHFLGALSFAKYLDRTLILPPWVEYDFGSTRSRQVTFSDYFSVAAVQNFHRAITMEDFMRDIAPTLWPPKKRIAFCWGPRKSHSSEAVGCNAKDGNPFGPFWDYSHVDFVDSAYFGTTVGNDALQHYSKSRWDTVYTPSSYPVLAFTGAPASFPVSESDRHLHQYLVWSERVQEDASEFIATLPEGPFIGIHLRNDIDWDNVCKHVDGGQSHLFASPQCLGYGNEHGKLSMDLCKPSKEAIVKQTVKAVKEYKAKSVFVAADRDHMISKLNDALKPLGVKAYRRDPDDPQVSLAILGRGAYYIGNCLSSFSAFAKRERDARGRPSGFWNFGPSKDLPKKKAPLTQEHSKHSEL